MTVCIISLITITSVLFQIRDLRSEKKWAFVCNRWLDVAEDDGLIKRKLEVARKEDLVQFDFLFAQTARKNLYDGHLWFSIFTRPPRSTFTRCQRLACCLTLLMTTMLSGAMFYRGPEDAGPPENALHLGPITISLDQIRISVTSTLVVVPVNIIIVNLFQKARPKEDKKQKYEKTEEDDDEDGDEKGKQDQPPVEVSDSKISLVEKGELG